MAMIVGLECCLATQRQLEPYPLFCLDGHLAARGGRPATRGQQGACAVAQESAGRIVKAPPSSGVTARKWRSSKVRIRRVR